MPLEPSSTATVTIQMSVPASIKKKFDCFQEDTLTVREGEIVDLIVKGNSSRKIAGILGISKWTVDRHRANIRKKLGISNVVDLVRFVMENDGKTDHE